MDAFAVLQPCDGAWRGGREGSSDTQRAVRVAHIAHDAPMTDRRRIVVLRDGTEVAKFRAKNVVGWHQTDD